jgi:hypothetical protein
MKFKAFALFLALSLAVWAQDAPTTASTPNSTPAQAKGCCHHNAAGAKDGKSCCPHAAADAKDAAGCCGGKDKCEMKDAKSCCDGKDTTAAMQECKKDGCCADGKSCGGAKTDKTAAGCCGNRCEHHQHTPEVS